MIPASELLHFNLLPAGRAVVALTLVKEIASSSAQPLIEQRCETCIASYRKQYTTEEAWRKLAQQPRKRADAEALNSELDEALAFAENICQTQRRNKAQPAHAEAAELVLAELYPNGLAAITKGSYEAQYLAMKVIAEKMSQQALLDACALLGVDAQLKLVSDKYEEFGVTIRHAERALSFRDVRAAREQSHEELCELMAAILTQTYGSDDANVALRKRLLSPLRTQADIVTAQRAERGQPTDVDPDSGAEQPLTPIAELV